jgi:hypothetical protein
VTPASLEVIAAFMHGPRDKHDLAEYLGTDAEQARLHIKQMHDRGLLYVLEWRRSGNRWIGRYEIQRTPHELPDAEVQYTSRDHEVSIWNNLVQRHHIDPAWKNYRDFKATMGPRPSREYRVVKLDPAKVHGPTNSKWGIP